MWQVVNSARRVVGRAGGFVGASGFALLVLIALALGIAIGFGARVGKLLTLAFRRGFARGVSWKADLGR